MKFTCSQQKLSKALNIVSKAVSTKTTVPVLKGIMLSATGNMLILSASDLDLSIEKIIDVNVIEEGLSVIPAKLFGDIIRKLPNEEILIEEEENGNICIKTSKTEFKIIGFSAEDFPNLSDDEKNKNMISLDREIFKNMISGTSFAAATDESRGVLTGVLIEIEENCINMVALDGFRMSVNRETMNNDENKNIIISAKILNEINKIIAESDKEGDIKISFGQKKAFIKVDDTNIILRLLEGDFIKYRDILPKTCSTTVIISKAELIESIERASLLAKEGKNNLIRIAIKNNLFTLTSKSEEGNVKEEVIMEKQGEDLEIGFNSKYMLDALKAIDDEYVKIELNTSITPALIKPVEGDFYEYLVLPVRISLN